jgi:quercetin dioxygenase-like cupin family protein
MKVNIFRKIPWVGGAYFKPVSLDENGLVMESCLRAGQKVPPHLHLHSEEHFLVKQGHPTFLIGKEKIVARPGDRVKVPIGVEHTLANETKEDILLETSFLPAADVPKFLSIVAGLQDDGEKKWLFKAFFLEKKEGLRSFSSPSNLTMKIVWSVFLGITLLSGRLFGWKRFIGRYV